MDWSATLTIASRESVPWFPAKVRVIVPGPVPLDPEEIVAQLASAWAVHEQDEWVVTPIVADPPSAGTVVVEAVS